MGNGEVLLKKFVDDIGDTERRTGRTPKTAHMSRDDAYAIWQYFRDQYMSNRACRGRFATEMGFACDVEPIPEYFREFIMPFYLFGVRVVEREFICP